MVQVTYKSRKVGWIIESGVDLQSDKEKEATLGKGEHMAPRLSGSSLSEKRMIVKGVPSYL